MALLPPFAPPQLPFNSLSDEVGALFALLQNGVHAVKGTLWKAGRHLLVVDLSASHRHKIDDITNCYKPYFWGYHLLTNPELMISSIHQNRRAT